MLILMEAAATLDQAQGVLAFLDAGGLKGRIQEAGEALSVVAPHASKVFKAERLEVLPGVRKVVPITSPFKFASADAAPHPSVVEVAGVAIGGGELVLVAGPCGVESEEQLYAVARYVAGAGLRLLRAGAFKPRTSPYAFQGMGSQGLRLLEGVRREFGLGIVTEATEVDVFDEVEEVADLVQIGARNMQNFALLRRAGRSRKPVLLKRGPAATLEEWLLAAEYVLGEGNPRVVLCERGIRTWSNHARNTLDISVVPAAKCLTHLPVMVDPSHAVGRRELVIPCALAAVAAGADGLLVETHCAPEKALSDGPQALLPTDFQRLVVQAEAVHRARQASPPAPGLAF
ncbi:MAG: 3-deoxy-7-phosphoheptulonate synthase [Acidobacteria bacterium]|nr:3-deoxy-7-phosphoheptulonate synthase [Acidobacteriota bacterium]